jgi:hypothetical protein
MDEQRRPETTGKGPECQMCKKLTITRFHYYFSDTGEVEDRVKSEKPFSELSARICMT